MCDKRDREKEEQPLGLHESELERTGLELGPTKSADVDGEVQAF